MPNATGVEVAIEVMAGQLGQALAVVDEAAGERAEVGVVVLDQRGQDFRRAELPLGAEGMIAYADAPAVVAAALDLVDHLPQVLPDFTRPEVARLAIEAEAPRLPQAIRVQLGPGAG